MITGYYVLGVLFGPVLLILAVMFGAAGWNRMLARLGKRAGCQQCAYKGHPLDVLSHMEDRHPQYHAYGGPP